MIELIPAIDIIDGKCVRLSQGDYNTQKVYNETRLRLPKNLKLMGFIVCTLSIWMEQPHAML